ncbi:COP23 domain-containing protein [Kamptonema sp. UHCC 0994]|uniref:COP23 domain-containing protein n=1 Tax=Kamptonema sp. UHCC 0994 TaxID=3031329 RepID=UPI0023B9DECC|nr:COP23 domain-containing protein [Kamptonema sp. UHCC 0994]MDF0554623.1 COP23 domain-containing protein [Kamptonema sp. UHCC 0994]
MIQHLKSVLTASAIAFASFALASSPAIGQTATFFCGTSSSNPATIATQEGKNIPVILWVADNYFSESGEDAITRCTRVSGILNSYRQQGNWNNIITVTKSQSGQSIICAANSQDGSCRLLYQVPKGQTPEQARQELIKRVNNPSLNPAPIQVN